MRKLIAASLSAICCLSVSVSSPCQSRKPAPAQPAANAAEAFLPLRRVILYKNGIGYFEHSAKVNGSQELHIDFTSGQLNDALASLTAYDLGNGQITSVRFNSIAPLSERLRALHLPLNQQTTREEFLNALRGTRVKVQSGATSVTGKLLSVERTAKPAGPPREMQMVVLVSVITDSGDLRSFELGPGVSVGIAEGELRGDVAQYLKLIGSERAEDVRRMTITDDGTGDRTVRVSYISEVPIWKSTYRILLPSDPGGKPLLQGWAVVDNTLGEDWKDVQLALVSGAPQSFVQNLSVPYYIRRPEVPLPQSVLLTPQTHEGALMPLKEAKGPGYGGGIGAGNGAGFGPGQASGSGGGVYSVGGRATGGPAPAATPESESRFFSKSVALQASAQQQTVEPQATGRELSELFEYDIKNKVTVGRNQSALVPILQANLDAEKVTLWNAGEPVPLRALWLTNSSGLALDTGTFNVVDDGTFAGEGLFDTISAGQKRLVSYAADPAVQVSTKESSPPQEITRIRIAKGLMITTREMRQTATYRISDSDTKPRTVVIEHPVREDWKLTSDLKPDETTATYYRFKMNVNPKESAKLVVEESSPYLSQIVLSNLTEQDVEVMAREKRLTPEMEAAFHQILEQKNAVQALENEIMSRQQDVATISKDQDRIRENMKALKGTAEEKQLLARYVGELDAQEDRLSGLRSQLAGLNSKRMQAAAALDQMIAGITLDVAF